MWYYLVRYSFDAGKPVFGPFDTEEDAWEAALADAQKEFDIDQNENEYDSDMSEYEEYGEIVLVNHFTNYTHTTEYILFKL